MPFLLLYSKPFPFINPSEILQNKKEKKKENLTALRKISERLFPVKATTSQNLQHFNEHGIKVVAAVSEHVLL